jgi:hypothetical protein
MAISALGLNAGTLPFSITPAWAPTILAIGGGS